MCYIFERLNHHSEYNISDGGESPFGNSDFARKAASKTNYSNVSKSLKKFYSSIKLKDDTKRREKISQILKEKYKNGELSQKGKDNHNYGHKGYKHPKGSHDGNKNSQFGTHWYTNGEVNVKAKECPEGFKPGRI